MRVVATRRRVRGLAWGVKERALMAAGGRWRLGDAREADRCPGARAAGSGGFG